MDICLAQVLLNILYAEDSPLQQTIVWPTLSMVPRWRNATLKEDEKKKKKERDLGIKRLAAERS